MPNNNGPVEVGTKTGPSWVQLEAIPLCRKYPCTTCLTSTLQDGNVRRLRVPRSKIFAARALTALLVHLVVDRLRDLGEPAAIGAAAHDIADAAIGPEHRAVAAVRRIPHLRRLGRGLGGVDREA